MLSNGERQQLQLIERHLTDSDPRFAAQFELAPRRYRRWPVLLAGLGWMGAVLTAAQGWWAVMVILLGPLIAVTVGWLIDD